MSGGEKARIALAKTIISRANFLLLDEPTNHLDMHSVELLIEALLKYEGSYLLVSHDRYFVSRTANKIWEIIDGKIRVFKGSYTEYLDWKERKEKELQQPAMQTQEKTPTPLPATEKSNNAASGKSINKEVKKELQRRQKELTQVEDELTRLQSQLKEWEALLADPATYSNKQLFLQTEQAYQETQKKAAALNSRYEALFEQVLALEEQVWQ